MLNGYVKRFLTVLRILIHSLKKTYEKFATNI